MPAVTRVVKIIGSENMRSRTVGLLSVLSLMMSSFAFALAERTAPSEKSPPLLNSASFGRYVANTYFDEASKTKSAYLELLKDQKGVYRQQATHYAEKFVIGTLYGDDPDARLVTMCQDVTGDASPTWLSPIGWAAQTAVSSSIFSKSERSSERSPTSTRSSAIGVRISSTLPTAPGCRSRFMIGPLPIGIATLPTRRRQGLFSPTTAEATAWHPT